MHTEYCTTAKIVCTHVPGMYSIALLHCPHMSVIGSDSYLVSAGKLKTMIIALPLIIILWEIHTIMKNLKSSIIAYGHNFS